MIDLAAQALVASAGIFLLGLGVVALVRPQSARQFLLGFAASASRHYLELAVRLAIGAALVAASPRMAASQMVAGAGWVLLATTVVMLLVPWQSHRAFAKRTVPRAMHYLPAIGVTSIVGGASILWALAGKGAA